MADSKLRLAVRVDPDYDQVLTSIVNVIVEAYDRGAISWERRCELVADPSEAIVVRTYNVPTDDTGLLTCGVFVEISPKLLAEIDGAI